MTKSKIFFATIFIAVFALLGAQSAIAAPKDVHKRVTDFFNWVNHMHANSEKLTLTEAETFVAPNFVQYENDIEDAKGPAGLLERLKSVSKQYKQINIRMPLADVITEGNKAAVRYEVELVKEDGTKRVIPVIAFLEYNKEGKIERFWDSFPGGSVLKGSKE